MRHLLVFFLLVGCGDSAMDGDAGPDASVECSEVGTPCGDGMICTDDGCAASACGDGLVDDRTEDCDDSNTTAFDGCEPTCRFTCAAADDCDDTNPCNGEEMCADHRCAVGAPPDQGTACSIPTVPDGTCRARSCVVATCGDGDVDDGEECDDGNDVTGDGCEVDCRFSCMDPPPEVCDGEDQDCDGEIDEEVSTLCWPDEDRDGYSAVGAAPLRVCGLCPSGTTEREPLDASTIDCDDAQSARHPGQLEVCDGIDADCTEPTVMEPNEDFDGDGRVALDAPCTGGLPKNDCLDTNALVFPGQAMYFAVERGDGSFDYDCSGADELRWTGYAQMTCTANAPLSPPGWCAGAQPGCGGGGTYASLCTCGFRSCGPTCDPRTQECR